MKNFKTKIALAGLLLATLATTSVNGAESPDPYANETPAQRDARMKWFREARFGMFIHWGVYAVPAGTYNGKRVPGLGEWIMNRGKIPMAEYQAYAKDFNPVKYDPDAWVRLAKEAGMKYIVITSKHHDGFALFDSKVNDWDIVGATPYGKDLLKPLAEACRKQGIKLGFYYSQAQDWNNGGAAAGGKWDPAQEHDMDDYIDKVAVPQVKELMSNYGEFPAVLWWDTPKDMNRERAGKLIELLKLKPGIIHNNRLGGDYKGDTETPEQFIPATGFPGRDWETCMTMNDTWGFKSYDENWKSTETIIRNLVDIASKGGNYLLNVGPTAQGEIPAASIERLKAVGAWMKDNSEAIYATTASPFKRLPWGRCTKKVAGDETTLYLHVFNWPTNGKLLVPGLKNSVGAARMLVSGQKLKFSSTAKGVELQVPAEAPDKISSTIVLQIKGAPDVGVTPIFQESDGSVRLMASEADLHGGLLYEGGGG
ncbi:MAG: alpha-L-fucosidase, partial [Verrucomicrobiota bacterium]